MKRKFKVGDKVVFKNGLAMSNGSRGIISILGKYNEFYKCPTYLVDWYTGKIIATLGMSDLEIYLFHDNINLIHSYFGI